jgi:hypothetical protein|tara:strand:- start:366 stop:593 length:228 start_codon:yes stop_codon:yes gene_type:complete
MGVEIISNGTNQVLICNTSMTAFGPVFYEGEDVEDFLIYSLKKDIGYDDVRELSEEELIRLVSQWREELNMLGHE